jgi:ATP-dependent DNA helicase RecQ
MFDSQLLHILKSYWGFDGFLPLQREAMQCVLENRDSLVVMPTGGGKSLCFQAPALCRDGLAVVVSPLLALMKDQVDALTACGMPAAAVNSTLAADGKRRIAQQIESGQLRLLYMSPERLVVPRTLEFLRNHHVSFFAIDEAHCISAWGHDFRPEYRDLRLLRDRFPDSAIHAYTATATETVRRDIAEQLGLRDAKVLVGDFRRPNLQYHVARRQRGVGQICSVIDRFRGQSGIIYCITRAEVDRPCAVLRDLGYSALPYHAGMSDDERIRNQEAFLTEQTDAIVATIAFGMGIDKSNVRYVIAGALPAGKRPRRPRRRRSRMLAALFRRRFDEVETCPEQYKWRRPRNRLGRSRKNANVRHIRHVSSRQPDRTLRPAMEPWTVQCVRCVPWKARHC